MNQLTSDRGGIQGAAAELYIDASFPHFDVFSAFVIPQPPIRIVERGCSLQLFGPPVN